MQWATLGKNGSEAVPQLQGRIARAFSSNSLVNTMEMKAAIEYILTAAQSLGSRDYYHHYHQVMLAWISLTRSLQASLSFIALGRSSGRHPVSS